MTNVWLGIPIPHVARLINEGDGIPGLYEMRPGDGWRAIASHIGYPHPINGTDLIIDTVEAIEEWARSQSKITNPQSQIPEASPCNSSS